MELTEEEYCELRESDSGFCTNCKQVRIDGGIEPDAHDIECPTCGQNTILGIEEALLQDFIFISED